MSEHLHRQQRYRRLQLRYCCLSSDTLQQLERVRRSLTLSSLVQIPNLASNACTFRRFGPRLRAVSYSHVVLSLQHVLHGWVLSHFSFRRRQTAHAIRVDPRIAREGDFLNKTDVVREENKMGKSN